MSFNEGGTWVPISGAHFQTPDCNARLLSKISREILKSVGYFTPYIDAVRDCGVMTRDRFFTPEISVHRNNRGMPNIYQTKVSAFSLRILLAPTSLSPESRFSIACFAPICIASNCGDVSCKTDQRL